MDVRVRGGGRRGSGEGGGERRGRVGGRSGYTRVSERKERGIMRETWVWERGGGWSCTRASPEHDAETSRAGVGSLRGSPRRVRHSASEKSLAANFPAISARRRHLHADE